MNQNNGKKYKKIYYHWIGELNGQIIYLNLNRKNLFNYKITIYCQHCHKQIQKYTISKIFNLRNTDDIQISSNARFFCKKCAAKLNSINRCRKT